MKFGDILTEDRLPSVSDGTPVSVPLHQTSLFTFPDVQNLGKALDDESESHLYTRGKNPTVEAVEEKIAALEGGEKCKLLSSGVSAIACSILSQVSQNDHIICSKDAYTWAKYISETYLGRFGVSVSFVDTTNPEEVEKAIRKNTKILYLESPGSLLLRVSDLSALADIAKHHKITTIVDNTWATPINQNPLAMGIDMVVHSASKYLGGHSDVVGGAVIGSNEYIDRIFETEFLPIGHVPDPFQAWLIQRGMRTLHLRLPRHYQSALDVCDYLFAHNKIAEIYYPMHPDSEWYECASDQMRGGCGVLSFKTKTGDTSRIETAVNQLKHFRIGISWGGYESLVFPAFTIKNTDPSLVRLHIGLEETDTLIQDLDQAFLKL